MAERLEQTWGGWEGGGWGGVRRPATRNIGACLLRGMRTPDASLRILQHIPPAACPLPRTSRHHSEMEVTFQQGHHICMALFVSCSVFGRLKRLSLPTPGVSTLPLGENILRSCSHLPQTSTEELCSRYIHEMELLWWCILFQLPSFLVALHFLLVFLESPPKEPTAFEIMFQSFCFWGNPKLKQLGQEKILQDGTFKTKILIGSFKD